MFWSFSISAPLICTIRVFSYLQLLLSVVLPCFLYLGSKLRCCWLGFSLSRIDCHMILSIREGRELHSSFFVYVLHSIFYSLVSCFDNLTNYVLCDLELLASILSWRFRFGLKIQVYNFNKQEKNSSLQSR